jgi:hypothetical protein
VVGQNKRLRPRETSMETKEMSSHGDAKFLSKLFGISVLLSYIQRYVYKSFILRAFSIILQVLNSACG